MAPDVERLLRKLAPLRPQQVARWRRSRELTDPETRALLDRHILLTARRVLGDDESRPLLSLPPEKVIKGSIHLGQVVYDRERWPIGISRAELLQHLAILGRSGSGKTNLCFHLLLQLSEKGIPWLFLDWKRTARHLLPQLKGRVHVSTPGRSLAPLPFNPFMAPPGVEPEVYLNHVVDVLGDAYTLGDAARSIIQKALLASSSDAAGPITVDRVIETIEQIPGTERVRGWKASALRALESLQAAGIGATTPVDQRRCGERLGYRWSAQEVRGGFGGQGRFAAAIRGGPADSGVG